MGGGGRVLKQRVSVASSKITSLAFIQPLQFNAFLSPVFLGVT